MSDRTAGRCWSRRRWLSGAACLGLGALAADDPKPGVEGAAVEDARRRAREAGLRKVGTTEKGHYVAVGDAPAPFRERAVEIADKLAGAYRDHFKARGFPVGFPAEKLLIVTLAGRASYEAFKGEAATEAEGGHYDLAANRLVIYDFRAPSGKAVANALRTNSFTLVHEAMHQLTFATGLLCRTGDVPVAISEGLATYGELSPVNNPVLGRVNRLRLEELLKPRKGLDWLPLDRLLTDDPLFAEEATEQLAYAQGWLLVYHLLSKKPAAKRFLAYLSLMRTRKSPETRVADAEKTLGDLTELDNALKRAGDLLR